MARYAIIEDGLVKNIIEAEPDFAIGIGAIQAGIGNIGDTWDGESFTPAPPPPVPVPSSITRRQGKLILSRNGLLEAVEAAIQAMEGQAGVEARIDWADALEWDRTWPLLDQVATGFGLTSEQIDQMFIDASAL